MLSMVRRRCLGEHILEMLSTITTPKTTPMTVSQRPGLTEAPGPYAAAVSTQSLRVCRGRGTEGDLHTTPERLPVPNKPRAST